jgi:hypothetical protein
VALAVEQFMEVRALILKDGLRYLRQAKGVQVRKPSSRNRLDKSPHAYNEIAAREVVIMTARKVTAIKLRSASAALLVALVASSSIGGAQQGPVRDGIFQARIESKKTSYVVGESIELRVLITNRSAKEYATERLVPWFICQNLDVFDGTGRRVVSRGLGPIRFTLPTEQFMPGVTKAVKYWDSDNKQTKEWADLSFFGYQIAKAGTYTITCHPTIYGYSGNPGEIGPFVTSGANASNTITIYVY